MHFKGLVPRLWLKGVRMFEKGAEVVCGDGEGSGGVVKWCSLTMLDIISSSGFGYAFGERESASISGSSTT